MLGLALRPRWPAKLVRVVQPGIEQLLVPAVYSRLMNALASCCSAAAIRGGIRGCGTLAALGSANTGMASRFAERLLDIVVTDENLQSFS
jgi:hypothetical protein